MVFKQLRGRPMVTMRLRNEKTPEYQDAVPYSCGHCRHCRESVA